MLETNLLSYETPEHALPGFCPGNAATLLQDATTIPAAAVLVAEDDQDLADSEFDDDFDDEFDDDFEEEEDLEEEDDDEYFMPDATPAKEEE